MLALYITTFSSMSDNPRGWIIIRSDGQFEAFILERNPHRPPSRKNLDEAGYNHLPSTELIPVTRPFWNDVVAATEGKDS